MIGCGHPIEIYNDSESEVEISIESSGDFYKSWRDSALYKPRFESDRSFKLWIPPKRSVPIGRQHETFLYVYGDRRREYYADRLELQTAHWQIKANDAVGIEMIFKNMNAKNDLLYIK